MSKPMEVARQSTLEAGRLRIQELIQEVVVHFDTNDREILSGGMCVRPPTCRAREEIIRILHEEFVISDGLIAELLCMSREAAGLNRKRIAASKDREWKLRPRIRRKCDKCGGCGEIIVQDG